MEPLKIQLDIDPNLPREVTEPAVALGDFEAKGPGVVVYPNGLGQLSQVYVDLICGRPLPLRLIMRELTHLGSLATAALFSNRKIALSSRLPAFISAVELSLSLREGGLAHVDRDLARLLKFLDRYVFGEQISKNEFAARLAQSMEWIGEYIESDKLPVSLPRESDPPKILDRGTNGFVLAEVVEGMKFLDGVIELYREGHFRGVLFGKAGPRQIVLAFKKSKRLAFDLDKAAFLLNESEKSMDQPAEWKVDGLMLGSPAMGTVLPRKTLIDVFVRV